MILQSFWNIILKIIYWLVVQKGGHMLQPSRGKVVTLISNVPQTIHTITSNKNGQEFNKNLKIMTRATKAQVWSHSRI
jgi:hypothetical protein